MQLEAGVGHHRACCEPAREIEDLRTAGVI